MLFDQSYQFPACPRRPAAWPYYRDPYAPHRPPMPGVPPGAPMPWPWRPPGYGPPAMPPRPPGPERKHSRSRWIWGNALWNGHLLLKLLEKTAYCWMKDAGLEGTNCSKAAEISLTSFMDFWCWYFEKSRMNDSVMEWTDAIWWLEDQDRAWWLPKPHCTGEEDVSDSQGKALWFDDFVFNGHDIRGLHSLSRLQGLFSLNKQLLSSLLIAHWQL